MVFLIQLLNGLQLAALLFLLSVGLSVVFGLMRFINLAHGTMFMFGAYLGVTCAAVFDSFWAAFFLAPLLVAAGGAALYGILLRHIRRKSPMQQVLVTFGLIFIGFDVVRMVWGRFPYSIAEPAVLAGGVHIFGQVYPAYRLFLIALGIAVMAALYFGLEKTRVGAMVRAGVDNRRMAAALGINVERVFFFVFCLGCGLAGLAGVAAAPVFPVFPGMDMSILILALIVVVVGGPGSLKGAMFGSLLVGMADTFGQVVFPEFAAAAIYALMAAVLMVRPAGLFPAATVH